MSWSTFASMGGYGLYIWSAYAITFCALGAELLLLVRRRMRRRPDQGEQR